MHQFASWPPGSAKSPSCPRWTPVSSRLSGIPSTQLSKGLHRSGQLLRSKQSPHRAPSLLSSRPSNSSCSRSRQSHASSRRCPRQPGRLHTAPGLLQDHGSASYLPREIRHQAPLMWASKFLALEVPWSLLLCRVQAALGAISSATRLDEHCADRSLNGRERHVPCPLLQASA